MERIHHREGSPLRRLPHPEIGDQTAVVDLCAAPQVAQDLVAGLEGPSGEDVRLRCRVKAASLILIEIRQNLFGGKMENTRNLNLDLGTIAWGAFFILWGITEMFPSLPEGTGALGIGIILIGLNLVRLRKRETIGRFTTTFGILAFLLGALQLARMYLHLSFELPIFAILLLALGLILLVASLRRSKNHD
jgi:hypothetical protein